MMFHALRSGALRKLWIGQVFSAVGDEIYRVGLVWIAINLIGADVGYLSAGQAAALMVLSFIGGKWADTWRPLQTMIVVDVARAFIVLIPVIVAQWMTTTPLLLIWTVALTISGLSAFFDPALQSCLPRFSPDTATLRAATGLMSTTFRLARMVGPALVGFLSAFLPTIHFFTLDALTFFVSALSVLSLQKEDRGRHPADPPTGKSSFYKSIQGAFSSVSKRPGMPYAMLAKAITGGTWSLALTLGFALLIHQMTNGNTQVFGTMLASYGVGNFLGALYFGNRPRTQSEKMMFRGYILLGCGFISMGLVTNLYLLALVSGLSGFSGPMNDLAFVDLIQKRYPLHELTKIFRLRMALETTATLILMLLAPWLFKNCGVRLVIGGCGIVWILCGLIGLMQKNRPVDTF